MHVSLDCQTSETEFNVSPFSYFLPLRQRLFDHEWCREIIPLRRDQITKAEGSLPPREEVHCSRPDHRSEGAWQSASTRGSAPNQVNGDIEEEERPDGSQAVARL